MAYALVACKTDDSLSRLPAQYEERSTCTLCYRPELDTRRGVGAPSLGQLRGEVKGSDSAKT